MTTHERLRGVLLGTAIGDAIGLPFEGLSAARVEARLARTGGLRHSLVLGRGMISDDTEHAWMTALALLETRDRPHEFARALAWQLRRWFLALPPASGLATARGSIRLLLGWSPARSGVSSAGNGPMMRAAVIGALAPDDERLAGWIRASSRMTHSDPRAEQAALVIARLVRAPESIESVLAAIEDPELRARTTRAWAAGRGGASVEEFRGVFVDFEHGVSGFVNDTLPAAVYCAARWPADARAAIDAAVRLGGDTDTVAALVGALVGARVGGEALPQEWIAGVCDWPIGIAAIERLVGAARGEGRLPRVVWLARVVRNLTLLAVVVGHVLARWLGR